MARKGSKGLWLSWLERTPDKREVGSSNLPRPTRIDAGWSSPVARWAHNPKVAGSNPAPATKFEIVDLECLSGGVAQLAEHMVCNHGVRGSTPLTSTRV